MPVMKHLVRTIPWIALAIALSVSLSVGRYSVGPVDVVRLIAVRLGLSHYVVIPPPDMALIFWNIRLPRILMSLAVGSGISIAGVVFQALFRNPLAAPDILGVTAGGCFGAALAIMLFTQVAIGIQGCAFITATAAVAVAYTIASRSWDRSSAVLVISGVVVSALFQAGLSVLMYLAEPYDQLARIIFWTMGSFHVASWDHVRTTLPLVITASVLLTVFGWRLNIMTQNDEEALSLGIDIYKWRLFYVTASTLMVASSVAAVGSITWVGLIIPHIARYLTGADHRKLIPAAALLGGTFLLLMDTIARTISAAEIPVSIVTSILGAPFLGYLLIYKKGGFAANDR